MKDKFYRFLAFWGTHGTKALIHILLFKLKIIKSLSFPFAEDCFAADTAATARERIISHYKALAPLRVYSSPAGGQARVSLITDSINSGYLYGGVGTTIILAALLAEARGARLRVVTRTERAHPHNLGHVLDAYGIRLANEVEFAFAPFYDQRYEIDICENEFFITTSWWTTAVAMASVTHDSILYLLQEDERMFYPFGDDRLRCEQILGSGDIRFVVNTRLLFDHLLADGLDNIAENAMWFEPAFPREIFHPRAKEKPGKRTFMFYTRPGNLRNLFYFGIEVIEDAIFRGVIDLEEWEILLVGKEIPDLMFAEDYKPEKFENLSWMQYAELIGKVDLGLCLMYTPHPSYPPLDLAASGAVVVTNRYGNKRELGNYSKNIICGDLDKESMVAALGEGVRLAMNTEERALNHSSTALSADWRLAFSDVLQRYAGNH